VVGTSCGDHITLAAAPESNVAERTGKVGTTGDQKPEAGHLTRGGTSSVVRYYAVRVERSRATLPPPIDLDHIQPIGP